MRRAARLPNRAQRCLFREHIQLDVIRAADQIEGHDRHVFAGVAARSSVRGLVAWTAFDDATRRKLLWDKAIDFPSIQRRERRTAGAGAGSGSDLSGGPEPVLHRPGSDLSAILEAELGEHALHVILRRAFGYHQLGRDLSIGEAVRQ